ncbi:30S ribosomal protein S5 [Candidatus Peregrinibacteria bacterium]|nr:30S ribosomal protein S5 [Candidatus Peregrinibacteria bacterium]
MAQHNSKKRGPRNEEAKEFQEEVLQIDRVTRVVKGGRRLRFRATVVIGNLKGRAGLGIGKSNEVVGAIRKGITKAKKNLCTIPIYQGTIPHEITMKYKSSKIMLRPASIGTGLIAGGSARKILELIGVKNIISKAFGSSNRINNAKATIKALMSLRKLPGRPTDNEKMPQEKPKLTDKTDVIPQPIKNQPVNK